jgi:uncharacterized protein with FMN-binding domain
MKKKGPLYWSGAVILTVLLLALMGYQLFLSPKLKIYRAVAKLVIPHIDLSKVKDGSYSGKFLYADVRVTADVNVSGGKITGFSSNVSYSNKYVKKGLKGIITRVLKEQKNNVDAVTGATTTSKAVMKALLDALKKGLKAS